MFSLISGIGWDSRAHFRIELVQSFIFRLKLDTLFEEESLLASMGVSVISHLIGNIFMM